VLRLLPVLVYNPQVLRRQALLGGVEQGTARVGFTCDRKLKTWKPSESDALAPSWERCPADSDS